MLGELAEARRERDRRVHDRRAGRARGGDQARVLSSIPVLSITGSTAPCSAPPSEVKSFWYSIRTTAVLDGSMGTRAPLLGSPRS